MNPVFFRKDKFDMVRTITFWLSDTPEVPGSMGWGASLPRIVTWMELVDKNSHEHFFYFNTHFAHDSDSARIMSSKILLERSRQYCCRIFRLLLPAISICLQTVKDIQF